MAEYHAKTKRVLLEIFIPYTPDVLARLERTQEEADVILAALPDWLRPRVPIFYEFHPAIVAFDKAQDWIAIRDEFSRKAKKLGLSVATDVPFKVERTGLRLEVWAQ